MAPKVDDKGRKWPQFLATSTVSISNFTNALHIGWPTPFLPKIVSDDYPFDVSSDEASYITIISFAGNILGGFVGTALIDKIGRRRTILLTALPQLISFATILLSTKAVELLYIARFIGGLAEGSCLSVVPIYLAEIAEPEIRGTLGTILVMYFMVGMVFINLVGSLLSMTMTAAICMIFPILFIISFWKMPETPYYLLMKNQQQEAAQALRFLRHKNNVDLELDRLGKDVQRQMSESGGYRDVFLIKTNRIAIMLIMGARLAQQMSGCTAFTFYAQILIKQATDALEPALASTCLLLVQLGMTVSSSFLVDRFGRKPLLIASLGACCADLVLQSLYYLLKEHTTIDLSTIDWFPLLMMVLYIMFFAGGAGVVVNILQSELFSNSVKPKAVAMVNVVFALAMMSTIKFYQATADNFGLTVPFSTFAVCSFLGVLFYWKFLPETKGKTLEEIQQMLKGHGEVIIKDTK